MPWIECSKRMPEKGERVLLYGDDIGIASVVAHLGQNGEWVDRIPEAMPYLKRATHWRPLPKPPKENKIAEESIKQIHA